MLRPSSFMARSSRRSTSDSAQARCCRHLVDGGVVSLKSHVLGRRMLGVEKGRPVIEGRTLLAHGGPQPVKGTKGLEVGPRLDAFDRLDDLELFRDPVRGKVTHRLPGDRRRRHGPLGVRDLVAHNLMLTRPGHGAVKAATGLRNRDPQNRSSHGPGHVGVARLHESGEGLQALPGCLCVRGRPIRLDRTTRHRGASAGERGLRCVAHEPTSHPTIPRTFVRAYAMGRTTASGHPPALRRDFSEGTPGRLSGKALREDTSARFRGRSVPGPRRRQIRRSRPSRSRPRRRPSCAASPQRGSRGRPR